MGQVFLRVLSFPTVSVLVTVCCYIMMLQLLRLYSVGDSAGLSVVHLWGDPDSESRVKGEGKGKGHPRTGHEAPDGE